MWAIYVKCMTMNTLVYFYFVFNLCPFQHQHWSTQHTAYFRKQVIELGSAITTMCHNRRTTQNKGRARKARPTRPRPYRTCYNRQWCELYIAVFMCRAGAGIVVVIHVSDVQYIYNSRRRRRRRSLISAAHTRHFPFPRIIIIIAPCYVWTNFNQDTFLTNNRT